MVLKAGGMAGRLASRRAMSLAKEWIGSPDAVRKSHVGQAASSAVSTRSRGFLPLRQESPAFEQLARPASAGGVRRRMGTDASASIVGDSDEWELMEGVEMVRDGSAKQKLLGIQMVTGALKGVPVLPVELPPLAASESERLDTVRRVWAAAFDDLAPPADTDPNAEEEEGVISDLQSFGEVDVDAISDVVRTLRALGIMRPGELGANEKVNLTAWDLGSGSGKAVLGMALLHPFEKVVGVEQDEGVHADSHERLAAMRDVDKDQLLAEIHLVGDEVRNVRWTTGDFITVNCTRFSDVDMLEIAECTQELSPGAIIVSFSRRIASPFLNLVDHRVVTQGWGDMPVFIQQRAAAEDVSDGSESGRPFPVLSSSSDTLDQVKLREAGILPLLVDISAGADAGLRPHAGMCISFLASSEANAKELLAQGALASSVRLAGEASPAARAAAVMAIRALASHPYSIPHVVDDDDAVPALVKLLADESLAIAAGAADALILSCTFLDAIAVVGQHGAREGLQGLVQRAKEARNANTQETAQFALDLMDAVVVSSQTSQLSAAAVAEAGASPVHAHLQKLGVGHR